MKHFKRPLDAVAKLMHPVLRQMVLHLPPCRLRARTWRFGQRYQHAYEIKAQGVRISGHTSDLIQGCIYWFGVWEPALTHFILQRSRQMSGRIFVDVGANIGYYTLIVASTAPHSSVVAVEAFPPTLIELKKNIERNKLKNVIEIGEAAGAADGNVEIFYAGSSNGGATTTVAGRFDIIPVTVKMRPLSQMLSAEQISRVKLIKIDVEGAELEVMRGLISVVDKLPLDAEILVELAASLGSASTEIFESLIARGFAAYEVRNEYTIDWYLSGAPFSKPRRLSVPPPYQVDVVFSRSKELVVL